MSEPEQKPKAWVLMNVDCRGLMSIVANPDVPVITGHERDHDRALAIARFEAMQGDAEAQEAVRLHDRDAQKLFEYGVRGGWIKMDEIIAGIDEEED